MLVKHAGSPDPLVAFPFGVQNSFVRLRVAWLSMCAF